MFEPSVRWWMPASPRHANEVSEPGSACDAVARALQAHEEPLSYSAVAKIWSKRDKAAQWMDELLAKLGYSR